MLLLIKNKLPRIDIGIPNCSSGFCPRETNDGRTLIYIRNHLSPKNKIDLNIYKSSELDSTFIFIWNPKKTNIIIGCINKHRSMTINEFNDDYLNDPLH